MCYTTPYSDQVILPEKNPGRLSMSDSRQSETETPIEKLLSDEGLPEDMTEEELEAFLLQNGVFDKLLSQLEQVPASKNWEAELDEL
jgi:hypothetical protein